MDHIPPEVAVSILNDAEAMNEIDLRMPSEEEEIFMAERYRDPTSPNRMYRYYTGAPDPDNIVSYNMRTDAQQSTTFQGVMHEDINTSMITAINRYDDGIREDAQVGNSSSVFYKNRAKSVTAYHKKNVIKSYQIDKLKKKKSLDVYIPVTNIKIKSLTKL